METKITVDSKPCFVQLAEGVELTKTDFTTAEITQLVMGAQVVTFRAARDGETDVPKMHKVRGYDFDNTFIFSWGTTTMKVDVDGCSVPAADTEEKREKIWEAAKAANHNQMKSREVQAPLYLPAEAYGG